MYRGYVKIWRRMFDSGIHRDHKAFAVWMWLLGNVKYKPQSYLVRGEMIHLEPGEIIIGRKKLAQEMCLSEQEIRSALVRLVNWQNITSESTNRYTKIKIVNWATYQQHPPAEQPAAPPAEQPRTNQVATTVQEGKNIRKKDITPPNPPKGEPGVREISLYEFYLQTIGPANKSRQRAIKNIGTHLKRHPYEDLVKAIRNYESTLDGRDPRYRKDPANFFGITEPFLADFLPHAFKAPGGNGTGRPNGVSIEIKTGRDILERQGEIAYQAYCKRHDLDPEEIRP